MLYICTVVFAEMYDLCLWHHFVNLILNLPLREEILLQIFSSINTHTQKKYLFFVIFHLNRKIQPYIV